MSVLVIAELQQGQLAENTWPLLTAAKACGAAVSVLVAGQDCAAAAEQVATCQGVSDVLLADHACFAHQEAEPVAALIATFSDKYDFILMPASTFGKNCLPRLAGLLQLNMYSDVMAILPGNIFQRAIYAGNAIATIESKEPKQLLSIRTTAFNSDKATQAAAPIKSVDFQFAAKAKWLEAKLTASDRPELTSANIVVSGGRGVASSDGFAKVTAFADQIGAAIGASRAAVDAGYAANDLQVGQTGKIVAPDVYLAFGISGAVQHLAGIKESKTIIAIDKDAEAPIFEVADYGFVGDLFDVLARLEQQKVEKI